MIPDLQLSVVDNTTTPPTVNTSRLSWATSIFYFGQLVGSYPMTYALQRFNVRYILGPVVVFWAIIAASTAGVTDWRGLLAQRFFLGMYLPSETFHVQGKVLTESKVLRNPSCPQHL
jgi:MFS family permease